MVASLIWSQNDCILLNCFNPTPNLVGERTMSKLELALSEKVQCWEDRAMWS